MGTTQVSVIIDINNINFSGTSMDSRTNNWLKFGILKLWLILT